MRQIIVVSILTVIAVAAFAACSSTENTMETDGKTTESADDSVSAEMEQAAYTVDTAISEVINNPVFGDYGRLIFPVDDGYYSGNTLGELRMTWYSNIDPEKTVEIARLTGFTVLYSPVH